MMPTAAKLFAAIGFALVFFFASESFTLELPEGTDPGFFSYINTAVAAICGWRVMGRLAGRGNMEAMTAGFRTLVVTLFYLIGGHALYEMLRLATKLRYDGPGDAVTGLFELILEFGQMLLMSVPVLLILVIGGMLAAFWSEWAGRRWN